MVAERKPAPAPLAFTQSIRERFIDTPLSRQGGIIYTRETEEMRQRRKFISKIAEKDISGMFTAAFWHSRSREEAYDIVQDAFVDMLTGAMPSQPQYERTWLTRVVINAAKQYRRRERKHSGRQVSLDVKNRMHHPKVESTEDTALRNIELAEVVALAGPLVLAKSAGFTFQEIAEATGKTIAAVKSQTHREREAIRAKFRYGED